MNKTLIIPMAADKAEYEMNIPYLFRLNRHGFMTCVAAIVGLDLSFFDRIYFTILKKHSQQYFLKELFMLQFKRIGIQEKAFVIELDIPTVSQPETIFQTVKQADLDGMIFIKDADSYFKADIVEENSICTFPLDSLEYVNPQNKSYVNVDDMYYVTNIIEKRILGRDFCAGGYAFEDVSDFMYYYTLVKDYSPLYMSHVIYAALLENKHFRPIKVDDYKDWGTMRDWKENE